MKIKNKILLTLVNVFVIMFFCCLFNYVQTKAATNDIPLFNYKFKDLIYESDVSEDDAWRIAMHDQLEKGNITIEDVENDYETFGSRDIVEESPITRTVSNERHLDGMAVWQPAEGADYLPLQRVKVKLFVEYTSKEFKFPITTTYTDDNGYYDFSDFKTIETILYDAGIKISELNNINYYVRIYPESTSFEVKLGWLNLSADQLYKKISDNETIDSFNYFGTSSLHQFVWDKLGTFNTMKIPYKTNNYLNKALQISQALVMGQRYAEEVHNIEIKKRVDVLYPVTFIGKQGFCYNRVMGFGANAEEDTFNEWGTILHEYGHFIQHNIDINSITLPEYGKYGASHEEDEDLMASEKFGGKGNKEYGAKLAWTEAWATIFSMMARDNYKIGYYYKGQVLGAGGANINIDSNDDFNKYTNFSSSSAIGEGNENSIMAFLWNLYNNSSFGPSFVWESTTIKGTSMFNTYVQNVYARYSIDVSEFGKTMAMYNLAPGAVFIRDVEHISYETSPIISWKVNGSQYNKLDKVDIIFYNKFGEEIYSIKDIYVSENASNFTNYKISLDDWHAVLGKISDGDKLISVAVKGYNTTAPVTGGYISGYYDIKINFSFLVYELNEDNKSYSVTGVFNKKYQENALILNEYNGLPVTKIKSNAFSNCLALKKITIPSNIEYIDSNAFENCPLLETIIVLREKDNITRMGNNAIVNCSNNIVIYVPVNRLAEYKNALGWLNYKNVIQPNASLDEVTIDCLSDKINHTIDLQAGYNKLLQLNIDCSKSYVISTDAASKLYIYNADMTKIYEGEESLNIFLSVGIYYLDISFVTNVNSGKINISYSLSWPSKGTAVAYNTNTNILSILHQSKQDGYHAKLYYDNNLGEGFFKFSLSSSSSLNLAAGTISIYSDANRTMILDRYSISDLYENAISNQNEKQICMFLTYDGYYYIDIVLPNNNYQNLIFKIEKVDELNFDYSDKFLNISRGEIFDNQTEVSNVKEVTISHRSSFNLDILTSTTIHNDIPIFIFEKTKAKGYDIGIIHYCVEPRLIANITPSNRGPVFKIILEPGTYYIGYSNNIENVGISCSLIRMVNYDTNTYNTLVSDPAKNQGYVLGTEVIFNNGECNKDTITEGFTRNLYLLVENRLLEPMSRLDYDWYSSDENKATVTQYGTVLAHQVNENTTVQIYAVLKKDPSIIYCKNFTILKDTKNEPLVINSNMSYSFSRKNGEYKLELDNDNCPYPMIQYYQWQITPIDNIKVSLDRWGRVTSTGVGQVILTGKYSLNSRITLVITLNIT